jgi:hypothetical protein
MSRYALTVALVLAIASVSAADYVTNTIVDWLKRH